MWTALGDSLPLATGLALSPFAVVTAVVLLLGRGGVVKTAAFGLGWFVAILVIATVAFLVVEAADEADHDATETGVDLVQLAFAALFLGLAVLAWRKRPAPGEPVPRNATLARLDGIGVLGALGLGLAQGFVVIKNIPLAVGAGVRFGVAGLHGGAAIGAIAVFAVVASAGIVAPLTVAVVGGSRLAEPLARTRDWLEANLSAITVTVLVLLGSYFLGQGLGVLG
ncbi:GAP family protein [Tsukamurella pseudospumae]|uniref:GAP family protein n=1 Tax=Tsukamurella pseudospumae TaxID=239498 RepID=A0A138AVA6_9ACTN|nr:GAP family protein [Tsukamurella pseudospumae]KXP00682.1 hypothetical protein AXK61_14770 [Tsukamurella pseudospumae]KXP14306.1 hypothetical protein AXK60_20640 [Tsukamurella pseudospumae]